MTAQPDSRKQKRRRLITVLRCVPLLASGDVVVDAVATVAAQEAAGLPTLDKACVIGSNVPRTDLETALPIEVITREEIERSGASSAAALLRGFSRRGAVGLRRRYPARGRQPAAGERDRRIRRRECRPLQRVLHREFQKGDALAARDRPFSRTEYRPELGQVMFGPRYSDPRGRVLDAQLTVSFR
jgi:hypothetical protein